MNVFKEWVNNLSTNKQIELINGMRDCDTAEYMDISMQFTRALKSVALESYKQSVIPTDDDVYNFLRAMRKYPMSFMLALTKAIEIVGFENPDHDTREWWKHLYEIIVNSMGFTPETYEEFNTRLKD